MKRLSLVVLLAAVVGCGPSVDPAWLVVVPRMTGLDVSVDDAGDRATPRPGETLRVQLLYAQPDGTPVDATWVYAVCEPATTSGYSFCGSDPFVTDAKLTLDQADRPFVVEIPEGYTARNVLFVGAVCMNGTLDISLDTSLTDLDPRTLCKDGVGEPQVFSFSHPVALDANRESRAPTMASITLGGEEWTATPPETALDACVGQGFPEIAYGSDPVTIEIRAAEGDLETYEAIGASGEPEERTEELFVESLSPFRELQRRFTFITADDPVADLDFEPTDEDTAVPEGGLLVPIFFVLRDQRGGYDHATRALCVTP